MTALLPNVLAALPYAKPPSVELGPLSFHLFGFCVGMAIICGTVVSARRAKLLGLDERVLNEVAMWAVVPGMIGAHLYSAVFYFPEKVLEDPLYLLYFWEGISSFGGFLGGTAGVLYYFRKNRLPFWVHAEPLLYGFVFAWIFGRLGCTVAFDHPGLATEFFLGMPYPESLLVGGVVEAVGTVRHNLGFYEFIFAIGLFAVLWSQRQRPLFSGWIISTTLLLYCPVRFAFDFLRASDAVYLGLTAGQFAAIGLFALGFWVRTVRKGVGHMLVPDGKEHVFPDGRKALSWRKAEKKGSAR
ncbi:MAG: prolipoprotein diacylglyceryl transferase [Myxococcota bacterium]|nr:prolipoprotein diacylglyceryl transferase [Myxococcota bacterium]